MARKETPEKRPNETPNEIPREIPKEEKVSTYKRIIEYINANVGKEILVKEMAMALGLREKNLRRYLRKIRKLYKDQVKYERGYKGRLVYKFEAPINERDQ